MRKIFFLLFFFIIFILIFNINSKSVKEEEIRGIFISYIELGNYLRGKNKVEGKKEVKKMVNEIDNLGFNTIILQVRSFSDAIYYSDIFPSSAVLGNKEGESLKFDVLNCFLKYSKKRNIKVVAWINPYRIRSDSDYSDISKSNPAYSLLKTEHVYIGDGIFYNPASKKVQKLIVEGIEEILKKYDVWAILFDDYFYPEGNVDELEYSNYLKENKDISLSDFRLLMVNTLVKKVYKLCHKYNSKFIISPDGNIENNYQKHYADVKGWAQKKGYVDYLMPQIYYGFYNETKPFYETIKEWKKFSKKVKLIPALAFYKVGSVDSFAMSGKNEWLEENDIIMREVLVARNLEGVYGFSLFRYDYLFNNNYFTDTTMKEVENLKKVLD